MILGKHNYIVTHSANLMARRLKNALVAPTIQYVPEGNPDRAGPGIISLPSPAYDQLLDAAARSLKAHGFKDIIFIGDSGGNQAGMRAVADALNKEWAGSEYKAFALTDYYERGRDNYRAWLEAAFGYDDQIIGSHAGISDTSQLLHVRPAGVRKDQLKPWGGPQDSGVSGDPMKATAEIGRMGIEFKVNAGARAIEDFEETAIGSRFSVLGSGSRLVLGSVRGSRFAVPTRVPSSLSLRIVARSGGNDAATQVRPFGILLVLSAVSLTASGPVGIYGIIDKVVFEPNEQNAERLQVWGAFAYVDGPGPEEAGMNVSPAKRGYLYFKIRSAHPGFTSEGQIKASRNEWADLKAVAGTGQAVGFGRGDTSRDSPTTAGRAARRALRHFRGQAEWRRNRRPACPAGVGSAGQSGDISDQCRRHQNRREWAACGDREGPQGREVVSSNSNPNLNGSPFSVLGSVLVPFSVLRSVRGSRFRSGFSAKTRTTN